MIAEAWLGVLLLAVLGTGHCVGMCGAFAAAVGSGATGAGGVLLRQVVYQLGKATSYVFVGLLLLVAGLMLEAEQSIVRWQNVVAALAGGLMIVAGLAYVTEWRPGGQWFARWWQGSRACGLVGGLTRSPSLFRALLVGWLNGFLPCGLSVTALLYLASFQSPLVLVGGAYVFGLGTLPGLALVALGWRQISLGARRWLMRATGVALIAFGALTIVRGVPAVHHWMHQHLVVPGAPPDAGGHEHAH